LIICKINKMSFDSIIAFDISKKNFDVAVMDNHAKAIAKSARFSNNLKGFDKLLKWLGKNNIKVEKGLFCLENTGIYHRLLVQFLQGKNAYVWVENPVQIAWSGGLLRGKNDAVDARRIMTYAFRNSDKAVSYNSRDKVLEKVASFLSLRERLQNCRKALLQPIKELKSVGLEEESKQLERACKKSITAIEKELKSIDSKILKAIAMDEELQHKYELAKSVKCVGFVAATYLLVVTNGFKRFETAKQLASYAGIAPFEYSSGTSIKGRTKVNHMANKKLKTVLHMCAVSSVRHNPEMKRYFVRKVGEGKNKMLVINAIRNKIVGRVISCVSNNRAYTLEYAA